MSARIASDPVERAIAASSDHRSRGTAASTGASGRRQEPEAQPAPRAADVLPPLPAPREPPGTGFAAAVMAGALSPRPETHAEAFRRLGSVWQPPNSSFHLLDRVA